MSFPYLNTDNNKINKAYRLALSTITCNTVNVINEKTGKLELRLFAGMGYDSPWVRDTSINLWNGIGLIAPDVMLNTLYSLVVSSDKGDIIGEAVGQNWDVVIWIIGAWYQYLYTGDKDFLQDAYEIAENTLALYEENEFDEEINLFRGPACYGDGVAAYPDIYAEYGASGIVAFAEKRKSLCVNKGLGIPMFTLSTNCLFYYAYILADEMAKELKRGMKYQEKAEILRSAINKTFWSDKKGNYIYIHDNFGSCDFDETLGVSFAILFGVADEMQVSRIFENHHTTPHGVACVWPTFQRYKVNESEFGRHSGTIWPFIQGFWADAAAKNARTDLYDKELERQIENALNSNQFAEIYHPVTGEVYGGLQEDDGCIRKWDSLPLQTWSASAYLRNIYMDLIGMNFTVDGIRFAPCGSALAGEAILSGLQYRNCILDVHIKGSGRTIDRFLINGKDSVPFVSNASVGLIKVEIFLK